MLSVVASSARSQQAASSLAEFAQNLEVSLAPGAFHHRISSTNLTSY